MRGFAPRFVCLSISGTDSHQTSDFCECFPTAYLQRRYRSGVQNFSDVPGKPIALARRRQGTWHIEGDTLCRTLTRRGKTTTACSEVWMWQDRVASREQGITVMEGFVRKAWR